MKSKTVGLIFLDEDEIQKNHLIDKFKSYYLCNPDGIKIKYVNELALLKHEMFVEEDLVGVVYP